MRIVVHVFLYLERHAARLQIHTDGDVKRLVLVGKSFVIRILDVASGVLVPQINIDIFIDKRLIKVVNDIILARKVYHRALVAFLVNQHNGRHAGLLGYESVVRTEIRSYVYNAGTVFCGDIIALDYAERSVFHRTNHWQQLFVVHAYEFCSLVMRYYIIRYNLVAFLIRGQVGTVSFRIKI